METPPTWRCTGAPRKTRKDAYTGALTMRSHIYWVEEGVPLAAELMGGTEVPRSNAVDMLDRASTALPAGAEKIRCRWDAGYFAAELPPLYRTRGRVRFSAPSAPKALCEHLPDAAVSVDHFHLVLLANDMLTQVRQRVSREQNGRRGVENRQGMGQTAIAPARLRHPLATLARNASMTSLPPMTRARNSSPPGV